MDLIFFQVRRCKPQSDMWWHLQPMLLKLQPRRSFYSEQSVIKEAVTNQNLLKLKPYNEIPAKRSILPSALGLILSGGPNYLHQHCDKRHRELGSIYREKLGNNELIFLADTKFIRAVIASEGRYPHHNVPECWSYFNHVNKIERGLFFQMGQPWAKLRHAFNKIMLDPRRIKRFSADILSINDDLMTDWKKNHSPANNEILVDDVKKHLDKWSIETTGFMLFGSRMGCVSESQILNQSDNTNSESKADKLVSHITQMFSETSRFQIIPVRLAHKFNSKTWRNFESCSKNMLALASEYAATNISRVRAGHSKYSIIGDLLDLGTLSEAEVSRSVIDLIIAAADTTSNSLQWMLYIIAKRQDIQQKLLLELDGLTDQDLLENLSEKSPYLRAFIREVLRLYPTAPFLARTLDRDIILDSYLIPAGKTFVFSLYSTSRSETYFKNASFLKPERWLRSSSDEEKIDNHSEFQLNNDCQVKKTINQHAYASLPFGIGARMCVGRRAAELEMSLFIASFVKEFKSSLVDAEASDREIGIKLNMILCPDRPIRLKLKPRSHCRSH